MNQITTMSNMKKNKYFSDKCSLDKTYACLFVMINLNRKKNSVI